jgi:DNA-binding MarR family transcriptional regulator
VENVPDEQDRPDDHSAADEQVDVDERAWVGAHDQQDEVDRLIHAWRRELPHLDVSPFEVLSRVTRLARHLDRARRLVFATHDLESWEFDVLTALRRAGTPYELSPGRLLTQTLVTSGTMTNRIDRLAAKGLVERRPDPTDRRGVRVRLTAKGQSRVDAALAGLLDHERALLAGLDETDRDQLATLLRRLLTPFDERA